MRYSPQSLPLLGARSNRLNSATGTKRGPVAANGLIAANCDSGRTQRMPYLFGSTPIAHADHVFIQSRYSWSGVIELLPVVLILPITRANENFARTAASVTTSERLLTSG